MLYRLSFIKLLKINFCRPLCTSDWEGTIETDLLQYSDNHGKRYYPSEIPGKWRYLDLTYTAVVYAQYPNFPWWPAIVRRIERKVIEVQFFPTASYRKWYPFTNVEALKSFRSTTIHEIQQKIRDAKSTNPNLRYTMQIYKEWITELKEFIDVNLNFT